MPRVMSETGREMLDHIPSTLRSANEFQSIFHCRGREFELLLERVQQMRRDLILMSAGEVGIVWWESLSGARSPGQSLEVRRANAARLMRRLVASGNAWEAAITAFVGDSWSYLEHDHGDPSTPAADHLLVTLPFVAGTAASDAARAFVASITSASYVISFSTGTGFTLDSSTSGRLDIDSFS